ncbi:hypothetical protein FRC00_013567 [Tulasnella sp. 408]|nr:hypothetical protein FRC00_013567 [Tulasnella sp. 408]
MPQPQRPYWRQIQTWRPVPSPATDASRLGTPRTRNLLPNVQTISWTITVNIARLPQFLRLISPPLKTLNVDIHDSASEESPDPVRQFFDGLTAIPELELRRQQNLKVLGISSDPYLEPHTVQGMLFPNLPIGLWEFSADVEFHNKSHYVALIQTILQRLPDLRVIKFVLSSLGSWDLSDFESLSPFLQNPDLEELTLYISGVIHLDTREIHALGKALPRMARLNLCLHYNCRPALSIQASSLTGLAKAFPNLQALTIHISFDDIPLASPSGESVDLLGAGLSKLMVLNVGRSSLLQQDVARMAEFLATLRLHPLFEIAYDGKRKSKDPVQPWHDVEVMVKLIQQRNLEVGNPTRLDLTSNGPQEIQPPFGGRKCIGLWGKASEAAKDYQVTM